MPALIWFREDLRAHDQTALYEACQWSTDGVVAVFLIPLKTWQAHDMSDTRINFILRQLAELQTSLEKLHIPLIIKEIAEFKNSAQTLLELAQQYRIQALFFNKQYELNELNRDKNVISAFQKNNIPAFTYDDQVIFAPETIKTKNNQFFSVFTPYKNAWLKTAQEIDLHKPLALPKKQKELNIVKQAIPQLNIKTNESINNLWPAGEKIALKQLEQFIDTKIMQYAKARDYPFEDATSKLSPYLSAGIISSRQCLHAALLANQNRLVSGKQGILTWINELIWREFYKQLIYHVPRLCMYQPYKLNTDKLPWVYDKDLFAAWQEGQTGYPIVDAAMRQLQQTGWMHNRSRMITAMFLSKILFIDWRWGEKHFMQNLIDGDFSANNGGWQWCASTSTDAVPYFRIFNPLLQSQKFDPNGEYIRQYCPELKDLDNRTIHAPYLYEPLKATNYPPPIIDYKKAREHTLKEFKKIT